LARAEGGDTASELAQKLGRYFRFVTKGASEKVTLANELEYARLYGEIQELRFCNRLRIHFDPLPPGWETTEMPALILQPLIENALEHGLADKVSGGLVRVGFQTSGTGGLILFVEDNGGALTAEALEKIRAAMGGDGSDALANIYRRLCISFENFSGMRALRNEMGGLRVEIEIPPGGALSKQKGTEPLCTEF
jgi:two-component system sensor histidine kinase YesM